MMALLLNANDSVSRSYSITKPSPLHPIYPSECGERTVNVMPSAPAETKSSNGVTITCDGNGVYTLSGTALNRTYIVFRFKDFTIPISVGQGGQGTMSLFNTVPSGQIGIAFLNGNTSIDAWFINSANRKNNSYVTMSGAACNAIQVLVPAGDNCDCVIKPCFTNDSIYPTSYEPYGYKLPLLSGSTPVDVYIGESQTTRRIKKLVLTGKEIWVKSGAYQGSFYSQVISGVLSEDYTAYCSHLTFTTLSKYAKGKFCFNGGVPKNCNLWFNQFDSNTTVEELKSYLAAQYAAGTPVTVWYVLATETTGIVNEPLMKIGDYSDTIDSTQTDAWIPTAAGSTTISWAGEGLAPSQFDSVQEWVDIPTYKRVNGEWVEE